MVNKMTYQSQHYQQPKKHPSHSKMESYNRPYQKRETEKEIQKVVKNFDPKEWYKC